MSRPGTTPRLPAVAIGLAVWALCITIAVLCLCIAALWSHT